MSRLPGSWSLVLDAARVEQHAGLRRAPELGRVLDALRGYTRDPGRPRRRRVAYGRGRFLEVVGVLLDERVVEPVALDQHVQDCAEERRVGARTQSEEDVGRAREWCHTRVGDDQLRAAVACLPDVTRRDRGALGYVRAGDEDHVGEADVAPGVRRAVDAERLLVRGARRHHAEAPVVVEVRRAEREPREFADQVRLLVVQRHARQHRKGVPAVRLLDALDLGRGAAERRVPGDRPEPARARRIALERLEQAVGVAPLEIALDALWAELALVEREVVPGLEPDDALILDLEHNAALLAAEAAVRLHLAVDLDPRVPAARWFAVEVGAVALDELGLVAWQPGHQPNPPTRRLCASVTRRRRHAGQRSW
jgi:hypothetical protein